MLSSARTGDLSLPVRNVSCEATLAALKDRRKTIDPPRCAPIGGRVVKFMGDGVLVASAVKAVEAAYRSDSRSEWPDAGWFRCVSSGAQSPILSVAASPAWSDGQNPDAVRSLARSPTSLMSWTETEPRVSIWSIVTLNVEIGLSKSAA